MDREGDDVRRVTHELCGDQFPAWSPDGEWIIFLSARGGDDRLFRARADGAEVEPVGSLFGASGARWSPDGSRIAYYSRTEAGLENTEIFVVDANGSNPRQMTSNHWPETYPNWSPDSHSLLFSSQRDGVWDLYSVDLADGRERRLTETTTGPGGTWLGVWSPDGERIAFTSGRSGETREWSDASWRDLEIWIANADGSRPRRLTYNSFADLHPSWWRSVSSAG